MNCWPSACYADVITVTPQHLEISSSSSNFISNVGLTRSKMPDLNFNQVKNIILSETCLDAAQACTEDLRRVKQTWLPLHYSTFGLVLRNSNIITNVELTRYKVHDFFNQVKTWYCEKFSLMLSRLELETFCVLSRRDNRYTTAPWDQFFEQ